MDHPWFFALCRDCDGRSPLAEAVPGGISAIDIAHENNCPFILAGRISPGARARYIEQFGYPIEMVKSPHKDN